jgi:hypothetical protein
VLTQEGEESGAAVVFEATLKEFGKEVVSTFEEAVREGLGAAEGSAAAEEHGPNSPSSTVLRSGLDVIESADMFYENRELTEELNEIEELAREPTNPLTEKAYEEDPGLKQAILDEIADVRSELQWNTAAQFMNKELVGIGGYLSTVVIKNPLLGVGMSGVGEWNSKTLKQVHQGADRGPEEAGEDGIHESQGQQAAGTG